jgi:hypothetical protein
VLLAPVIIARGAAAARAGYVISCKGCNPLDETAATMSPGRFGISCIGPPMRRWSTP